MARLCSFSSANLTNPYPFERPVTLSVTTFAPFTDE
ncbi:hypothetical protein OIU76_019108 [Salix suchowensis]|nr:hypothetical protein OIU76_019108 [Salix suchowensis]